MDPSPAPWRVLESSQPAVMAPSPGAERPAQSGWTLSLSPVTVAAAAGALVLVVAAFVLAAASTGGGDVRVDGGTALAGAAEPSSRASDGGAVAGPGGAVVVVEIAGAVRRPGVFRLPAGARVGDLIEAAGGYGPRLDTGRAATELNLAAKLQDGERVTVPSRDDAASSTSSSGGGEPSVGGSGSGGAGDLVDLNRATAPELEALPGIGPVTAGKIIAAREEAAFTTVDDLRSRKLVGAKTFDGLKELVTVR